MSSDEAWQRLSPFAIVYFTGRTLAAFLNALPVLAAGVIAVIQSDVQTLIFYVAILALLIALFATLHYLNFYYVQLHDRFLIRRGVLSRNRVEIPFNKVQNINIKQPWYFRPLKLVVLSIDSAGSASKEVEIAALRGEHADRIKQHVMAFHQSGPGVAAFTTARAPTEISDRANPILTRSTWDILIHGFTNNRAWLLLAFLAPALGQMDAIVGQFLQSLGVDFQSWMSAQTTFWLALFSVTLLMFVFVIMSLLSMSGAMLALFNYQLFYKDGIYTRKSGLFNRYEIQVKKTRVQTLKLAQSALDLVFDRSNLTLVPFSSMAGRNQYATFMQKILVPSLTREEANRLAAHIYPGLDLSQVRFRPISRHYILRKLLTVALPSSLVLAVVLTPHSTLSGLLALSVFGGMSLLIWLRWRRYGVATTRDYVLLRSGLLGTTIQCLPAVKVQQVGYLQSFFMRRRRLANLQLVAASRTLTLPFIPSHYAENLTDLILAKLELSETSWM